MSNTCFTIYLLLSVRYYIIRAHACSAGYSKDSKNQQALGRSKGNFTIKIHALVGIMEALKDNF